MTSSINASHALTPELSEPKQPNWLRPITDWRHDLLAMLATDPVVARVLVVTLRGSAPREAGACMLVGKTHLRGTIGGGHLEWQAISAARALLHETRVAFVQRYVLGIELGQCCGGVVELLVERYTQADMAWLRNIATATGSLRIELHNESVARFHIPDPLSPLHPSGREWPEGPDEGFQIEKIAPSANRAPSLPRSAGTLSRKQERGKDHDECRPLSHFVGEGGASAPGEGLPVGSDATPLRLIRNERHTFIEEPLPAPRPSVWIFGAGHVGQALAKLLADLPLQLTWIDSRADVFPCDTPPHIDVRHTANPAAAIAQAPAQTRFVILTHDHALDYAICRAVLARGDFAFAGLIGSDSKAARFRSRLAREDGFTHEQIDRLTCPIGIDGIHSKWPSAIAVAVAAQLLQTLSAESSAPAASHDTDIEPVGTVSDCSPTRCASCPSTHPR
jgi:xanthine dehydrogenase accessory factor